MKVVNPSYQILRCPDGEECLAFLERIGRVAYKSEDKIDDGRVPCPVCIGDGFIGQRQRAMGVCEHCGDRGWVRVREPSSHRLIRQILKTNRRALLKERAAKLLAQRMEEYVRKVALGAKVIPTEVLVQGTADIVDLVLENSHDDPPHESVIEHESITVLFTSNRGFTHELVRHRLAAFTQESTRYCNYSQGKFGKEIAVTERLFSETPKSSETVTETEERLRAHVAIWDRTNVSIEAGYMALIDQGVRPELARDLLPQVLKAEIVITANLREWRHIFKLRCSKRAHPDMRQLMVPLRDDLRTRIPIIFDEE